MRNTDYITNIICIYSKLLKKMEKNGKINYTKNGM